MSNQKLAGKHRNCGEPFQTARQEHEQTFDENDLRDFIDVFLKRMKSEQNNPNTTFDGKPKRTSILYYLYI